MSVKHNVQLILQELDHNAGYIQDGEPDRLCDEILKARHIFLSGAGRSGVMIRAFANRLMHLGFSVSMVGDMTSPHSRPGDLLIIGSGSGETESLRALAEKAKKNALRLAVFTMDAESTIAGVADCVVVLPGTSPKLKNKGMDITSIQPMGAAFEQILLLTEDALVMELMERTGQTSDEMFARHADLE